MIDEVAGQWIALLFSSAAFWARGHEGFLPYPAPIAAFLFFRLFDIWKPYPVNDLQYLKGGLGICADDMVAGVYAGLCLAIFSYIAVIV